MCSEDNLEQDWLWLGSLTGGFAIDQTECLAKCKYFAGLDLATSYTGNLGLRNLPSKVTDDKVVCEWHIAQLANGWHAKGIAT
jgi:hypothetical protein